MILKIFLTVLLLIIVSLLLYFIFDIFLPAVKNQAVQNTDPVFSNYELNFIKRKYESTVKGSDKRAVVLVRPEDNVKDENIIYNGIKNCALYNSVYENNTSCKFSCIGFGDCKRACPQNAISFVNGTAIVTKLCAGCGLCVTTCPKKLIALLPKEQKTAEFTKLNPDLSEIKETHAIEVPEPDGFKFFNSWYRILN